MEEPRLAGDGDHEQQESLSEQEARAQNLFMALKMHPVHNYPWLQIH